MYQIVCNIGACRVVWVPGQDLAKPHLMCNCGKRILLLLCMQYVHLCVSKHAYVIWLVTTCLHVCSSWYEYAWFEVTRAMAWYARACRHLWSISPDLNTSSAETALQMQYVTKYCHFKTWQFMTPYFCFRLFSYKLDHSMCPLWHAHTPALLNSLSLLPPCHCLLSLPQTPPAVWWGPTRH